TMTLFSSGNIAFYCFEAECDCENKTNDEILQELADYLDEDELRPRKSEAQTLQKLQEKISQQWRNRKGEDERKGETTEETDDGVDYDEESILEAKHSIKSVDDDQTRDDTERPRDTILIPGEKVEGQNLQHPVGNEDIGQVPQDAGT